MNAKAVNDTTAPDGLVPTLLIFGAYPRVAVDPRPTQTTLKRRAAVHEAMISLRKPAAAR